MSNMVKGRDPFIELDEKLRSKMAERIEALQIENLKFKEENLSLEAEVSELKENLNIVIADNEEWQKNSQSNYNLKIIAEAKVKKLTEKNKELSEVLKETDETDVNHFKRLKEAESKLDFKQGVIDGQNILIVEHQKRYDELKDRLAKAQDVLEDICHHVGKDCFATCKGDWSGTACLTYRIFDAMNGKALSGGQPPKGDASLSCIKGEVKE